MRDFAHFLPKTIKRGDGSETEGREIPREKALYRLRGQTLDAVRLLDLRHISFEGTDGGRVPAATAWIRRNALAATRRTAEQSEVHPLIGWVFKKSGLDVTAYRSPALDRRLPACLRLLRVPTPEHAQNLMERRPELIPAVLGTILIGVSDFFRDAAVFAEIERRVLPRLLAVRDRVRICSIGCSSGQELYSLAMLAAEAGALDRVELFGLDRRPEAVARATRGRFSQTEVARLSPARLDRFFEPDGAGWRARPYLASALSWQTADLFALRAEERWDLVLCRNVLIYLRSEKAANVWETLRASLSPGGVLITGKAEKAPAGLPLIRIAPSIYRLRP